MQSVFIICSVQYEMENKTLSVDEIEAEICRMFSDSEDDIFSDNTDEDPDYIEEEPAEISG